MERKEFEREGMVLVFYKKENDEKFSFLIKDEPELTDKLLQNVKQKRVSDSEIKYAVDGIFEKIKNLPETTTTTNISNYDNPIVELAEIVQKRWRKSIITHVVGKVGDDHCPTVIVEIELPDGRMFRATGSNQRIAKQKAAKEALKNI